MVKYYWDNESYYEPKSDDLRFLNNSKLYCRKLFFWNSLQRISARWDFYVDWLESSRFPDHLGVGRDTIRKLRLYSSSTLPWGDRGIGICRVVYHIPGAQIKRLTFERRHFELYFLICCSLIQSSPKFVPKGSSNDKPLLVQLMARCRRGDKPLSEITMIWFQSLLTHKCVNELKYLGLDEKPIQLADDIFKSNFKKKDLVFWFKFH